jgi:exonuclease VII small subunit
MSKESEKAFELELQNFDTLQKIVDQLESGNYRNEQSVLSHNVAFIKLKELAQQEERQKSIKDY